MKGRTIFFLFLIALASGAVSGRAGAGEKIDCGNMHHVQIGAPVAAGSIKLVSEGSYAGIPVRSIVL